MKNSGIAEADTDAESKMIITGALGALGVSGLALTGYVWKTCYIAGVRAANSEVEAVTIVPIRQLGVTVVLILLMLAMLTFHKWLFRHTSKVIYVALAISVGAILITPMVGASTVKSIVLKIGAVMCYLVAGVGFLWALRRGEQKDYEGRLRTLLANAKEACLEDVQHPKRLLLIRRLLLWCCGVLVVAGSLYLLGLGSASFVTGT